MLSQTSFFPCPHCNEIISSDLKNCRYCKQAIDSKVAEAAILLQERINQSCNDASILRNLAGFMWIAFAFQFIYALMGRLIFVGLMVGIPVMLIRWQANYGRIKTSDIDFKSAKRNRNIALLLWVPTPILLIVLIVVLAMAQSRLSPSETRLNTPNSTSSESVQSTWQTVTAEDGSYSVEFPGAPEHKSFQHTERGYTIHAIQLFLSSKPNHYFVASSSVPYKATIEDRLDSSLLRIKKSTPGLTELSRGHFSQNGCSGLEWQGRSSNYPAMTFRAIETSSRLFVLGAFSESNDSGASSDVQHFLESFSLSEKTKCPK